VLAPHQFQAVLTRFSLGDFVGATPIAHGLFGQNVFVTSTQGEYVLRGSPHYPWQFPKEQFGAALLNERTQVAVAHPYLFDPTTDIFGWPYLLMPRLYGLSPLGSQLTSLEQLDIARALGQNLAQLHALTWPFAGDYDLASQTIQPFGRGFAQWIVADIRGWLDKARGNGTATTADDVAWTERVIGEAEAALAVEFQPCFVMNDYNPGNVLVERVHGTWQVTGLFDFMEYYFGDGEADLMRLIAIYLDGDQQHGERLAQAFGTAYLDRRPARAGFAERYPLYMVRDRAIAWEYGTRPGHNWFPEGQSFRDYAERYTASCRLFAPAAT
jgi:aminoglycoside phosphotransferase (APT) family kinase protein